MADQTTVQEIIDYYTNLLIIQYHNQPKARAEIALYIKELLANGILFDIQEGFNIDTAVGVQLDIVGKYVDLDRFYQGQNLNGYFGTVTYDQISYTGQTGFTDYTLGFTKVGQTLIYPDVLSDTLALNDDDFRFLIKLRIIQNNINHSHESIDKVVFDFFGTEAIPDSVGNMQMYYFVQAPAPAILLVAAQKDLLPRPMAVQLALITQQRAFFGFASYSYINPNIVGFTTYVNPAIPVGEMLTYSKVTIEA